MPDPKFIPVGKDFTEFPGRSFNALVSKYYEDAAAAGIGGNAGRNGRPFLPVLASNTSGELVEPGHILGYLEPTQDIDDDPNQVYSGAKLKGEMPDAALHSSQFVVAMQPVEDAHSGIFGLSGLLWVKVNWTDDTHTKVKVTTGETLLQSSDSGITPVWHEGVPDAEYLPAELWALVLLGGGGGGTAEVNLYKAQVVVKVTAADSFLADGPGTTGWGEGYVRRIATDGSGYIDSAESPFAVVNPDPFEYPVDAQVDVIGNKVWNGPCSPAPDGFWDES